MVSLICSSAHGGEGEDIAAHGGEGEDIGGEGAAY